MVCIWNHPSQRHADVASDPLSDVVGSLARTIRAGNSPPSPPSSTSSLTYGVTVSSNDAGAAIYINRSVTDSGSTSYQRTISNITLLEISGS